MALNPSLGEHGSSLVTPAAMPIAGNGDQSVVEDAVGAPAASSMDGVDTKTDMSFINQEMKLGAEYWEESKSGISLTNIGSCCHLLLPQYRFFCPDGIEI